MTVPAENFYLLLALAGAFGFVAWRVLKMLAKLDRRLLRVEIKLGISDAEGGPRQDKGIWRGGFGPA